MFSLFLRYNRKATQAKKRTNSAKKLLTYPYFPIFLRIKFRVKQKPRILIFPRFFATVFNHLISFPLSIEVRGKIILPFIVSTKLKLKPTASNLHYLFLNIVFPLSRIWKTNNSTGRSNYSNKILNYILLLSLEAEVILFFLLLGIFFFR